MQITLNGEPLTVKKATTVSELLDELELDMRKVAVEQNLQIVPRSTYQDAEINDGDKIEIVHFIGGG
ncbi:MAG: sulfur carrier protein ThiS [Alphaproteobacteria bacterium]|nr:sulfur carrier protein ThiS [Alphaproteobacteria bacterium]